MKYKLIIALALASVLSFGSSIGFAQDEKRSKSGGSPGSSTAGTYGGPMNAAAQQPPPASPAQQPPPSNMAAQTAPPADAASKKKSKRRGKGAKKGKGYASPSEGTGSKKAVGQPPTPH